MANEKEAYDEVPEQIKKALLGKIEILNNLFTQRYDLISRLDGIDREIRREISSIDLGIKARWRKY